VKRISKRLGPVGWVLVIALGIPLVGAALADPVSDRAVAEQILATMPASSDSAMQGVSRAPLDEAKRALDRAAGARASGDAHHAELLEGLAREWAETARDLQRAVSVEGDAGALSVAAAEAGVAAERARALLEEAISRRGRAEAELGTLTADGGFFPTKPATSTAPAKSPKPAKPPPASKAAKEAP
jgi:hypothetical protein